MTRTWTFDTPIEIELPEAFYTDLDSLFAIDEDAIGVCFESWSGAYEYDDSGMPGRRSADGWAVTHLTRTPAETRDAVGTRNPLYAAKAWVVDAKWGAIAHRLPGAEEDGGRMAILAFRGAVFALEDPLLIECPFDSVDQEELSRTGRIAKLRPLLRNGVSGHDLMEAVATFRSAMPDIAQAFDTLFADTANDRIQR